MADSPKVSVIVPVYNAEKYLKRCVDSILAQTFRDFELLLINDGSADSSGATCDEYAWSDKRVRAIHKDNGGVSSSRNIGLKQSRGEWICYIDGDDWVEPTYIEELYNVAVDREADIVLCGFNFAYEGGRFSIQHPIEWDKDKTASLNRYISSVWTTLWGNIHKKDLYLNGLKCPENLSYCEDFHLMIRLCYYAKSIVSIDCPLYNYRQQTSSILHTQNEKTWRDEMNAYRDILDFFNNRGGYKKAMAWRTLKAAQDMTLDSSRFEEFKEYNPDKKHHIWDCPFIGYKIKVLSWLITHGCESMAAAITNVRRMLGR